MTSAGKTGFGQAGVTPGTAALDYLGRVVRMRSGISIGADKHYLLETRIATLVRLKGVQGVDGLARRIAEQGEEGPIARELVEAVTNNETFFFRNGYPFEHLRCHGLPLLRQDCPPGRPLRIWSAGASSGQEAYSIAMAVAEQGVPDQPAPALIMGTDIARTPLAQAARGLYSRFQVGRGVTHDRLRRHFQRSGNDWRVVPTLMALCRFHDWNLLDDCAALGMFDVVFCRNVLMYFDAATKAAVLDTVAQRLRPGGLLYLGGAETADGLTPLLLPLGNERAIYQRR